MLFVLFLASLMALVSHDAQISIVNEVQAYISQLGISLVWEISGERANNKICGLSFSLEA